MTLVIEPALRGTKHLFANFYSGEAWRKIDPSFFRMVAVLQMHQMVTCPVGSLNKFVF